MSRSVNADAQGDPDRLAPNRQRRGPSAWVATAVLALLLSWLGVLWVTYASIVFRTAQVGESVPPLPAVATLLFLVALRPVLRRVSERLALTQQQIVLVYAFTTITTTFPFVNGVRNIFELGTLPSYGSVNDRMLDVVRPHWPNWIAPQDADVCRYLWQGSPTQDVPWGHWLVPLLCLGAALVLFHTITGSLLAFLYPRWSREERLGYPVADLGLRLTEEGEGLGSQLLRNRVFWWGLVGGMLFNVPWIIPALRGGLVPPIYTSLHEFLPEGPWRAGYTWYIRYNPIVLGLGILVPTDVLWTIWFGTLMLKLEAVFLAFRGHDWGTTFHLAGRQGLGGCIAIAALMLWSIRRPLLDALWGRKAKSPGDETPPGRGTLLALAGSTALLVAWMIAAGMAPWLAFALVLMLVGSITVVARIRAQVGVPILYFHVGDARSLIFLLGGALVGATGDRSVTAMVAFSFLSIATYLVPYQADGFRLAERTGVGWRKWLLISLAAVVVGFAMSSVSHLSAYYQYGNERMMGWAPNTFRITSIVVGTQPDTLEPARWAAIGTGFLMAVVCIVLQRQFTWWPFHPVGFVVACAIGGFVFGMLVISWLVKTLALRYGGQKAYEQVRTFFLGIVIGHFFVASVWGLLGVLRYSPCQAYKIGFW